jgi:hypothetical protein
MNRPHDIDDKSDIDALAETVVPRKPLAECAVGFQKSRRNGRGTTLSQHQASYLAQRSAQPTLPRLKFLEGKK